MFVTEDKTAMVLEDTSVAISVVVEVVEVVEVAAGEAEVEEVHVTKMVKVDHRKMDRMEVANKEVHQDVVIHVSVVQCVGSKMAMPMVLR